VEHGTGIDILDVDVMLKVWNIPILSRMTCNRNGIGPNGMVPNQKYSNILITSQNVLAFAVIFGSIHELRLPSSAAERSYGPCAPIGGRFSALPIV
jgi:hypothetical protein